MIPYVLFFSFLFIISLFNLVKIDSFEKIEKLLFFTFWFVVVFFIGFRYKMANDWYNYNNIIISIEPFWDVLSGNATNFQAEKGIEYGFKILISLINMIFDPETSSSLQALTVLVSVFCYTVLFYFTWKEDIITHKFLFLATFLSFTMFREFDILRQSIAFYIFLLSIRYINKSFFKFFFINVIGFFFHVSALIFIPLYFVFKKKFSRAFVLTLLLLHLITMITHFSFVNTILERLSNYFPELIFAQKLYLNSIMVEPQSSISIVGILYAIYLLLLFVNYKKIDFNNYKLRFFINSFFIFIIINIFFSDSKDIADRFSYYFYFGVAFVFVYLIKYIPKMLYFPYVLLILIFPTIRFSRVISNPMTKSVLVPYRNYFFVTPRDEDYLLTKWKEKNEE
ncbi:EpsG family protein [Flavobacterium aquidurense]|uniref:EpsG family protein n=1 Tax=Flavobacterium frigidimaris TaxID=262320 RepID=A0ABX4BVU9_FLAFR|nr:EpsG family protein [Flavobacterium frigidimaris]OXA81443.1 hypothetical protein B0A65_04075 [Flavobacterium frigidimaris]SDZ04586.1 EpsG family protein [Flavobacterium aquidurense]